jgi:hypothetical protein
MPQRSLCSPTTIPNLSLNLRSTSLLPSRSLSTSRCPRLFASLVPLVRSPLPALLPPSLPPPRPFGSPAVPTPAETGLLLSRRLLLLRSRASRSAARLGPLCVGCHLSNSPRDRDHRVCPDALLPVSQVVLGGILVIGVGLAYARPTHIRIYPLKRAYTD